jgi:YebC/PmpR family DNA-binding regulatory protein
MSGHSKWHKIQHKKGKADSARSNLFTKLSRAVTVAASSGGGDPAMNFSLRLAIDKAKAGNVPKDNIERAIKRGTGELNDGKIFEEVTYEGFGPSGVAFLVETVTDNKNRTVSEIKHAFSKFGGSMGGPGSVQWQFSNLGVIRISAEKKEGLGDKWSDLELDLMDAGVDDIIENELGVEFHCVPTSFQKVLEVINSYNLEIEDSGLEWIARETVNLGEQESVSVEKLYDTLDELEDVKAVYTNEL